MPFQASLKKERAQNRMRGSGGCLYLTALCKMIWSWEVSKVKQKFLKTNHLKFVISCWDSLKASTVKDGIKLPLYLSFCPCTVIAEIWPPLPLGTVRHISRSRLKENSRSHLYLLSAFKFLSRSKAEIEGLPGVWILNSKITKCLALFCLPLISWTRLDFPLQKYEEGRTLTCASSNALLMRSTFKQIDTFYLLLYSWHRVTSIPGWPQTCSVAENVLNFSSSYFHLPSAGMPDKHYTHFLWC